MYGVTTKGREPPRKWDATHGKTSQVFPDCRKSPGGLGGRSPQRLPPAASDLCGGGGSPCVARVSPTERYEQVPSANSKKCKMHFFDTLRRPHRSSQSPAGMSFSMLSRARSLSITGYASEIGLSMVPSTISCFFLGRITITSGLECPKRERKSHECGFLLCKPHLAERETGEKTRNRRELSKNRVRAGTQNTNNRMVLIPALFVVQNA